MPETENDKTVELDTSGPGAKILNCQKQKRRMIRTYENEVKKNEANITYDDQPDNTSEKSVEQPAVRDQKNEGGEVEQKASEEKVINNKITVKQLKSILKELRKE